MSIVTVQDRVAITPEKLLEFNTQLVRSETKRKEVESLYNQVLSVSKNLKEAETIPAIASEPTVQSLRGHILKAEQNIEELTKKYGKKHPAMIKAEEELRVLQQKREQEVRRVINSVKNEYELAKATEASLRRTMASTKAEAQSLNEKFIEYVVLTREVETNRQLYDALIKRMKEQSVTEEIQTVNVWVVERAEKPVAPVKPRKALNILLGVNHETLQFFRLSLSYCYRALPLVWMVVARAGLIQVEACEALFEQAHQILPAVAAVTFLADRGFRDTDWAEKCLTMGWNYLIRVANNTYVTLADGRYLSIQQLNVPRGRCRYFTNVHLTQAKGFQCNLMITWTTPKKPGEKAELSAVITNLRPCHLHLKWYLKRMHVEESLHFLPWALAWPVVWTVARGSVFAPGGDDSTQRALRFLLAGVATSLVFFSISAGKRSLYLLPIFPAMALLSADALLRWLAGRARVPRALGVSTAVLLALLFAVGVEAIAAGLGHPVVLVERSSDLGGHQAGLAQIVPDVPPHDRLHANPIADLVRAVRADSRIRVLVGTRVTRIAGQPGKFAVEVEGPTDKEQLIVSADKPASTPRSKR